MPVVVERYQKEILRVFGVLESVLSKQEWLVGGKCTIADLAFIMSVYFPRSARILSDNISDGTKLR